MTPTAERYRAVLCELAEDDKTFSMEEQAAIMAAVRAIDALDQLVYQDGKQWFTSVRDGADVSDLVFGVMT